jgi:hypothetical protein
MHMHAMPGERMRQNALIRKSSFVGKLRKGAGLGKHWP